MWSTSLGTFVNVLRTLPIESSDVTDSSSTDVTDSSSDVTDSSSADVTDSSSTDFTDSSSVDVRDDSTEVESGEKQVSHVSDSCSCCSLFFGPSSSIISGSPS